MKVYKKKIEIKKGFKGNCLICNKEFISEIEHKFYCSNDCQEKFKQKEDVEKRELIRGFKSKEIEIKSKTISVEEEYHRSKHYKKNLKTYYYNNREYIKELRKLEYKLNNTNISEEEYHIQLKKLKKKYNKN